MSDTYDPDEKFALDMEGEEALRRLLGADEPDAGVPVVDLVVGTSVDGAVLGPQRDEGCVLPALVLGAVFKLLAQTLVALHLEVDGNACGDEGENDGDGLNRAPSQCPRTRVVHAAQRRGIR